MKKLDYYDFDIVKFSDLMNCGDINGLRYIEGHIIDNYKKLPVNYTKYTKEEYIINLYYATLYLNLTNDIYETGDTENNFDYDLYFDTKRLLLEELGIEYNEDYNMYQFKEGVEDYE